MPGIRIKALPRTDAERVYQTIKDQIESEALTPGDRLASFRDLQKSFGVSFRVINETIHRLVNEGWLVTRRGAGAYVRGQARYSGSRIKMLNSNVTGMAKLLSEPIIKAAKQASKEMNVSITMETTENFGPNWVRSEGETRFNDKDFAAHIWIVSEMSPDTKPPKAPVVFVSQNMESAWGRPKGYDIITSDSRQGGALAAGHLWERGCRRAIVLAAKRTYREALTATAAQRLLGFQEGWPEQLPPESVFSLDKDLRIGDRHIAQIILDGKPRPDGVFCISDETARALCFSLQAHGVQPGKDIKVVGFDAQPQLEEENFILTSVAAPLETLGRTAVKAAMERAAEPDGPMRRIQIGCDLRLGDTT